MATEENTPMRNGGGGGPIDITAIAQLLASSTAEGITRGFESVESQLGKIVQTIDKATTDKDKESRDRWERDRNREVTSRLSQLEDTLKSLSNSIKSSRKETQNTIEELQDQIAHADNTRLAQLLQKQLDSAKKMETKQAEFERESNAKIFSLMQTLKQKTEEFNDTVKSLKETTEAIEQKKQELEEVKSTPVSGKRAKNRRRKRISELSEEISNLTDSVKEQERAIQEQQKSVSEQEKLIREQEKLIREQESVNTQKQRNEQEALLRQKKVFEKLEGIDKSLEPLLGGKRDKRSETEKARDEALTQVSSHITALKEQQERIRAERVALSEQYIKAVESGDEDLIKETENQYNEFNERYNGVEASIQEGIEHLQKTQDELKKLNPTLEDIKKYTKDLVGQTLKAAVKNVSKYLTSRYIDSFLDGFNKIYDSVEKTRNEISARLRVNAGEYKDLQESLYAQIEAQGLQGTITQEDLNNYISSLVGMGITDRGQLEWMSMQQAKLTASGSYLDLTNDDVAQQLINYQRENNLSTEQMNSLIEDLAAAERAVIEETGSATAFANGGMQTLFSDFLDKATAANYDTNQLISSFTKSAYVAQQAQNIGFDSSVVRSMLMSMKQTKYSDWSAEQKALGLTPEDIKTMDTGDVEKYIIENLVKLTQGVGATELPYLMQAYGIEGTVQDIERLQRQWTDGMMDLPIDFQNTVDAIKDQTEAGLQNAEWISKTQETENKRANAMTKTAIEMEQMYKGNELFKSVAEPIVSSIESATDALIDGIGNFIGRNVGSSAVSGGTGSFLGSGGNMSTFMRGTGGQFLTGAKGTTAGKIGRGAGMIVGGVQAGASLVSHAKEAHTVEEFLIEGFSDKDTIAGAATMIGSAVAGPIGGMVGQVAVQAGSLVTDWLDKKGVLDDLGKLAIEAIPGGKIYTALTESKNKELEKYNETFNILDSAADKLLEGAEAQLDSVDRQMSTFEAFSTDQQRLYLVENGLINAQELNAMDDKQINEKFQELIVKQLENEQKKAEAEVLRASVIKNSVAGLTNIRTDIEEIGKMSTETNESGSSEQERAITSRLGGAAGVSDIMTYLTDSGLSTEAGMDQLFGEGNLTEREKDALTRYFSGIKERRSQYETENTRFQEKWQEAIAEAGVNASFAQVATKYSELFLGGETLPRYKTDDSGSPIIGENGFPILYDSDGMYYVNQFSEAAGNFRTGLTSVPYDEYPAMLHEGERVLTRSEAESYNKLSSVAVAQLANILNDTSFTNDEGSSSIFTSKTFDSSAFTKSIGDQTTSLGNKLDLILSALQGILQAMSLSQLGSSSSNIDAILRMNSNITQIATAGR